MTSKEKFPNKEHWAIIKFGQLSQPGYDAGDPPYMVSVTYYEAFLDKVDWERAIVKLEKEKGVYLPPTQYVAVHVGPPAVTTITVNVQEVK